MLHGFIPYANTTTITRWVVCAVMVDEWVWVLMLMVGGDGDGFSLMDGWSSACRCLSEGRCLQLMPGAAFYSRAGPLLR